MELRSKYYTYPVISEDTDFYVNSTFSSKVEQTVDGYNIRLKLIAELENPELQAMIDNESVMFAHHIECTQTCFRKVVLTKDAEKEYIIHDSEVNGLVQICSFVVAIKTIEKYSNSLLSQDYKGFRFYIEKGCVMAIGNQINLRINKVKDDLANTSSIFSIVPNMDELVTNIKVDISRDKIVISVPQATHSIYVNMSANLEVQPIMHSMLIIPALVYAITEVKENRAQLYYYEENRWYRSLRKAIEKMGIELNEENLENIEPFDLAQKLMDSPIPKAVDFLRGDEDGED